MSAAINPHDDTAKQAWQSPEKAASYRRSRDPDHFGRYQLEDKIIGSWLDALPANAVVLDIPCGAGRLLPTILGREFRYVGADFSAAMIDEARKEAGDPQVMGFVRADAERMPLLDNSVDCVIIWRLFHHLAESRVREAMLREAARVSRNRVLISFHHALSFTAIRRSIQRSLFGRKHHGRPITHWRLSREASRSGLGLVETKSFGKYRSTNWFACFQKVSRCQQIQNKLDCALVEMLCCPETKQSLTLADAILVERLNQQIAAEKLQNRAGEFVKSKLEGGLVRADGKYAYPVLQDVPILLVEDAIPLG
jgi:ubiquinone/menaquinone biosynthesis C-methylase UbiE/uncharacterized protein YbaR (Trm112 family)